jgi:hypothetical protein
VKQLTAELDSIRSLLASASDESGQVREENCYLLAEIDSLKVGTGPRPLAQSRPRRPPGGAQPALLLAAPARAGASASAQWRWAGRGWLWV